MWDPPSSFRFLTIVFFFISVQMKVFLLRFFFVFRHQQRFTWHCHVAMLLWLSFDRTRGRLQHWWFRKHLCLSVCQLSFLLYLQAPPHSFCPLFISILHSCFQNVSPAWNLDLHTFPLLFSCCLFFSTATNPFSLSLSLFDSSLIYCTTQKEKKTYREAKGNAQKSNL